MSTPLVGKRHRPTSSPLATTQRLADLVRLEGIRSRSRSAYEVGENKVDHLFDCGNRNTPSYSSYFEDLSSETVASVLLFIKTEDMLS
jgi:hypothetical protein